MPKDIKPPAPERLTEIGEADKTARRAKMATRLKEHGEWYKELKSRQGTDARGRPRGPAFSARGSAVSEAKEYLGTKGVKPEPPYWHQEMKSQGGVDTHGRPRGPAFSARGSAVGEAKEYLKTKGVKPELPHWHQEMKLEGGIDAKGRPVGRAFSARGSAVKEAEEYIAKKAVARASGAGNLLKGAAKGAGVVARGLGRALPVVGVAADVATTGAAVYQGAKAYSAHSDLTRTAESLEKKGIQVEKPSFNPLKAAYPGVFGEHPEVKVKEVNRVGEAALKKKLGS